MERSLKHEKKQLIALERFFPHHIRSGAEQFLFALSVFFLTTSVFFSLYIEYPIGRLWPISQGLFLITFGLLLETILIEIYFHSLRMRLEEHHNMSFATLLVIELHHPVKKDLAKAFLHSKIGREMSLRLGIPKETIQHFMHTKDSADLLLPTKGRFVDLAGYLHDHDPYFQDFLNRVHITKEVMLSAAHHTERRHHEKLANNVFLRNTFFVPKEVSYSVEDVMREEADELERFYQIIITEQALQKVLAYFKEDMLTYASSSERTEFLVELIEWCLSSHKERFHGASIILPADVRNFIINKKALL